MNLLTIAVTAASLFGSSSTMNTISNISDFTVKDINKKEIKIDEVRLRGKIDRIDINEEDKTLKVVDYKLSGKSPTIEDLKTGLSLQLPLYLFAAKEMISAHFKEDFKSAGAQIFSLKYSEKNLA